MKILRFSISNLMILVLVVAFDFAVARMCLLDQSFGRPLSELMVCGALPMANILALGLFACLKPRQGVRGGRRALVGFEVCGGLAWLIFLAVAWFATDPVYQGVGKVFEATHVPPGPIKALGASSLILLPQVAFALLGGWVNVAVIRWPTPSNPRTSRN